MQAGRIISQDETGQAVRAAEEACGKYRAHRGEWRMHIDTTFLRIRIFVASDGPLSRGAFAFYSTT